MFVQELHMMSTIQQEKYSRGKIFGFECIAQGFFNH